jgi:hypothetical protein
MRSKNMPFQFALDFLRTELKIFNSSFRKEENQNKRVKTMLSSGGNTPVTLSAPRQHRQSPKFRW